MPVVPTDPPPGSRLPGWLLPSVLVLVAGGALGLAWAVRDPARPAPKAGDADPAANGRNVPAPPDAGLHSVTYAVEHGVRVIKIRVVPNGDELVIDAETGRLLETRPAKRAPPVPKPMLMTPRGAVAAHAAHRRTPRPP